MYINLVADGFSAILNHLHTNSVSFCHLIVSSNFNMTLGHFICLFIYLFLFIIFILFIYLFVYLFICLFLFVYFYLSIYLFFDSLDFSMMKVSPLLEKWDQICYNNCKRFFSWVLQLGAQEKQLKGCVSNQLTSFVWEKVNKYEWWEMKSNKGQEDGRTKILCFWRNFRNVGTL